MRNCKDWTIQTIQYNTVSKVKWNKATVFSDIANYNLWMVTMGNAATCKACGSDIALKTSGSDKDSNHHSDFYRATDSGSDADDSLVRGGERNMVHQLYCYTCFTEGVFKKACRVDLFSTPCVCMRFDPLSLRWGVALTHAIWWGVWLCWPHQLTPTSVWLTRYCLNPTIKRLKLCQHSLRSTQPRVQK